MALENKLGITNSAELAREEERISKKKAVRPPVFTGGLNSTYPTIFLPVSALAVPPSAIYFRAGYSASAS